jgi:hypothetical protein
MRTSNPEKNYFCAGRSIEEQVKRWKKVGGRRWKLGERSESQEDRMGGKIQCTHFPTQLSSSHLKMEGSWFP